MGAWEIWQGDALDRLREMPDGSVQCCITSPPYFGLRDYGVEGQIGLEETPDEYVSRLVAVFSEVRRVLTDDGTLWLNLGDSYAGSWGAQSRGAGPGASTLAGSQNLSGRQIMAHPKRAGKTGSIPVGASYKAKDLLGIPWTVALACRADGWYLRRDIIWNKPNPMPESVTDRPTSAHEYIFLLSKSASYFYDADAIREAPAESTIADRRRPTSREWRGDPRGANQFDSGQAKGHPLPTPTGGRNKRSVWEIATQPYPDAHFAVWPEALVLPMVLAGSRSGDIVLDPFAGSGTTLKVAVERGRDAIGIELNPEYVELAKRRLAGVTAPLFGECAA